MPMRLDPAVLINAPQNDAVSEKWDDQRSERSKRRCAHRRSTTPSHGDGRFGPVPWSYMQTGIATW